MGYAARAIADSQRRNCRPKPSRRPSTWFASVRCCNGHRWDSRLDPSVLCLLLHGCDRAWWHDVRTKFPSRVIHQGQVLNSHKIYPLTLLSLVFLLLAAGEAARVRDANIAPALFFDTTWRRSIFSSTFSNPGCFTFGRLTRFLVVGFAFVVLVFLIGVHPLQ